jgi:phage FluMu protein Com
MRFNVESRQCGGQLVSALSVPCPTCKTVNNIDPIDGKMPFRTECERCSADLHVCLTCRFYDRYAENQCRETIADPVSNKDKRNLCDLHRIGTTEDTAGAVDAAKAKLAALFGGTVPSSTTASPSVSADPSAEAKRKLEALFKKP